MPPKVSQQLQLESQAAVLSSVTKAGLEAVKYVLGLNPRRGNRRLVRAQCRLGGVGTMHNIWNVTSHNIGRTLCALHKGPLKTGLRMVHTFHCSVQTVFTLFTAQCKVSKVTKAEANSLTIGLNTAPPVRTSVECILLFSKLY